MIKKLTDSGVNGHPEQWVSVLVNLVSYLFRGCAQCLPIIAMAVYFLRGVFYLFQILYILG